MLNSISYTQIKEAFEDEARTLAQIAGDHPHTIFYSRDFVEAQDGSEIFIELRIVDFDTLVQLGPVIDPTGALVDDVVQTDSLEHAARQLYAGLTYCEADVVF